MEHSDAHGPVSHHRAFAIGVALNVLFVVVEAVFGVLADSLALLADAGHNLSDVLSLLLAWGAAYLASREPTPRRTYGFGRATILASLANAVLLLVAIGAIAWEAIGRFADPAPVEGATIIWVAAVGVVINTATALLFMRGREHDINIRGAFLHMAADAGVSLGVVVAGIVILLTGWLWIDPTISLLIVVVIAVSTWGLLRDSINLILDTVPEGIDPREVKAYFERLDGIAAVHDLHIWPISTTRTALTAHVRKPDGNLDDALLARAADELRDRFGIDHITIQFERGDEDPCRFEPEDVV